LQLQANAKNLSITVAGETSIVHADKDRVNQVSTNLLSNAIKYTQENGEIRIAAKVHPGSGELIVEDNGIGIPESEQTLIFERFYRTDKSRTRKTGGAGIGLAIVKSIVSAHEGTIAVESRDPHGSRFTVTFPK
jgi:signal transduction histidine kinase